MGKDIPDADVKDLETKFGYIPENTYNIEKTENGLYKVKGYVTESESIKGFGADTANKFYFAFTINLADGVNSENVTVKISNGPNEGDGYNVATKDDFVDGKLTVLMEVEKTESTKYRDIIILIDDIPTRVRIDFTELRYVQASTFTIEAVDDEESPFDDPYG